MLNEPHAVVLIEWPERLGGWQIPNAYAVSLHDDGEDTRRIEIRRGNVVENHLAIAAR